FIVDMNAGSPRFKALRRINANHPIEAVGKKLRDMMAWLKKK
ncbi:MAG: ketol-acid reductoisomerase, partial [Desulfovibrionaceae bacterium]